MILLEEEIKRYVPAITLEHYFPRRLRDQLRLVLSIVTAILTTVIGLLMFTSLTNQTDFIQLLVTDFHLYTGLFLISISLYTVLSGLSFYYNQLYFRGIDTIVNERLTDQQRITYEVANILWRSKIDVTYAFLMSPYGKRIMGRLNIDDDAIVVFLSEKQHKILPQQIEFLGDGYLTLAILAKHVYEYDAELQDFLTAHGVTEAVYQAASDWIVRSYHERKHDARWWSRDNLGKLNSIAKDWSYGGAYMLSEFSRDMNTTGVFSVLSRDISYADEKVAQMESILARATDANVLLVGEQGVGKMDVVARLSRKIDAGNVVQPIVDSMIYILDAESFIAKHDAKESFEPAFIKMMKQAEEAGNVIVAIENLPSFVESAHMIGVDIEAILDRFLASPHLHFIATSDPMRYHNEIEIKPQLTSRFERVPIESPDLSTTIRVIEHLADVLERKNNTYFTYFAVQAIVQSADQFLTDGVMPDKAIDLLSEIASAAGARNEKFVTKEFVYEYVSQKTGIPAGPMTKMEREKLLNLEELLHERIVGQDTAVRAIASAMRRARAGIQSTKRPMGSLLFLGPTGVGKTETAKALAALFFGSEEHFVRFDMSEYSGDDALDRLIGKDLQVGTLTAALKERPYGVLLLDEFEKASRQVHDLFLQIIDEGMYTDVRGARISARNTILIATSNAGAQTIMRHIKLQQDPSDFQKEIVEEIIDEGVYRPELINRFDGTILFKPLSLEQMEGVAGLMLKGLQKRIQQKGFELVIDEVLVSLLTTEGFDPKFGARPMRRVMQDRIEDKIAQKIIEKDLKPGDKIWFYEEDFKM